MYRQWHLSHHQLRDQNGNIYAGAKAYFYLSDATTPIQPYQDYNLTTPHPWPVVANGFGILPPVFLDDANSFYRQKITTAGDVIIPGTDVGLLPIAGPPVPVIVEVAADVNKLFKTGYAMWQPYDGTLTAWIRMNGRTFGSASSGAAEYANAVAEDLFLYVWNNYPDSLCPVAGGRGGSAAADWAANKAITALDMRGYSAFGLDTMGNSAASRLSGTTFAYGSASTQAASGGENNHALITAELAAHNHTATSVVTDPGHTHTAHTALQGGTQTASGSNAQDFVAGGTLSVTVDSNTTGITVATTTANSGSGTAHNNMPPFRLGTWFWKL